MYQADQITCNLTAGATLVKKGPGRLFSIITNVAGANGTASDSATTGGVATANLICNIPATLNNVINFETGCPFTQGLVITAGAAQVLTVTYR